MTVVLKFGGSSVATTDKMKEVAQLILRRKEEYSRVVVVVSAMGDTTDNLLSMASRLATKADSREVDVLLSSGELVSASLLALHLISLGHPAASFTGFQAGFKTVGLHRKSQIKELDPCRVEQALDQGRIAVVAGFQGMNEQGEITTLGRGGSDTSAVALAARLGCPCEIYTDVAGIYSVDPRVRPKAKKLAEVTYEEAVEMAYLGARVIEPRSVELAAKYRVPLYIALNTGEIAGTRIIAKEEFTVAENMEALQLTNISEIDQVLLVNIEELGRGDRRVPRCFNRLAESGVNLDLINQMLTDEDLSAVSFTTSMEDKDEVVKILGEFSFTYSLLGNLSKLSIIGSAMRHQVGVAAEAFRIFAEAGVNFYMVSTSDISISYVVDSKDCKIMVNRLADVFGL